MLYLAKVQKSDATGSPSLKLLACQKSESSWSLISSSSSEGDTIAVDSHIDCPTEGFVLLERADTGEIESLNNATDWVLMVIEQYIIKGLTPDILMSEAEQAEEWRQSLTLKSQDIVRRSLEVETRRDQIQELEKGLEDKRSKLDAKEEEFQGLKDALEDRQKKIDDQKALLLAEQQQLLRDQQLLKSQQKEWDRKQDTLQKEIERVESLRKQIERQAKDHQNILEMK